jgi:hypothetical protein
MAGDWLKMELTTPEKDETAAITAAMGWTDPDLTVGKLFRVWRWFDQHTTDGASRLTVGLLDRQVACPGFAEAMAAVGWLVITEHGITLPNFDRHNGETAKARALTARRVSRFKTKHESNGEGNAAAVTSALPREEKRREEKEEPTSPAREEAAGDQKPKTRKKTASHMTLEWQPSAEWISRLEAEYPAVDVMRVVPEFRRYWIGEGKGKANWDATFGNRVSTIATDIASGNRRAIAAFGRADRRTAPAKTGTGAKPVRSAADFGNVDWRDVVGRTVPGDKAGTVPAVPDDTHE